MAQADGINTAIRDLMSRGRPAKSTNPERAAHAQFGAAVAGDAPHPIHSALDSPGLDGRANHRQKVLSTLHVYVAAVSADLEREFSSHALRVIRNAPAEIRNWRAS
jgi:hypothetical protein